MQCNNAVEQSPKSPQDGEAPRVEDQEGRDVYILGSQSIEGGKLGIDETIVQFRRSLSLQSPDHPSRHKTLSHYALALNERFSCTGQIEDLDECIGFHREALSLRPPGHSDRVKSLNNLASALLTRFQNKGDFRDLEESITFNKDALSLCHPGHLDRGTSLNNLAGALWTRFQNKGDFSDLEECIAFHKEALSLCPPGHPDRASWLNNLANALCTRFNNKGDFWDLDECIESHKEGLSLCPPGHPNRHRSLNNLAVALSTRFRNTGDFHDLDECITCHKEALSLRDFRDLDECIASHQEALSLRPPGHPDRARSLNNLANALWTRFDNQGDFRDLEECISFQKEALFLYPAGHPGRGGLLNNLAGALSTRFENRGDYRDLEDCIALHREALSLRPPGHTGRASSLDNLANDLWARFESKGDFSDLEECIVLHKEALSFRPSGHPDRAKSLNNLANALCARFKNRGESRDLDESIASHKEGLSLCPSGHPDRARSLNNLANALSTRFKSKGDFSDLDECITFLKEVLSLRPPGHPHRAGSLNNLAGALLLHFQSNGDLEALTECTAHARACLTALSAADSPPEDQHGDPSHALQNHPDGLNSVLNLVEILKAEYKALGNEDTLNEIFELLESGPLYQGASPLHRLDHVRVWASTCREFGRTGDALQAYSLGVTLLPLLASLDLTLQQRQNVLIHAQDLAKDAVQCAFEQDELETALVFLSTARSVFWSQALQFRASLDRLDALHPDLASELRLVTRQLQIATQQHSQTESMQLENAPSLRPYLLSQTREEIIARIRAIDGFHDFLLPPSPDVLKNAARKGPIVFLNASKFGCHALILKEDGVLRRIELPTDIKALEHLVSAIRQLARGLSFDVKVRGDFRDCFEGGELRLNLVRKKRLPRTADDDFRVFLEVLWRVVGQPVVAVLGLKKTNTPPRIWWCPTGLFTFLPIHAAGIYSSSPSIESDCLSDYAVSSYCSGPQDLVAPPPEPDPNFKMLVAIEPDRPEPGVSGLPFTRQELEKIELRIPEKDRLVTRIGSKTAPGKPIVEDINAASIVHFGCHGMQDPLNPLDSCLLLSERRLTMSSLIRDCQNSTAALAYLSACETAMGDEARPDESLTLAATMQFAGFRSVVATMWSIHDDDAPIVADALYRHLFRNGKSTPPDITDAAYGLHIAVKELRELGRSFHRWVPFVHHGI
ncbi:hypothetical protein CC1G_03358 [Coprinopsis cinerea okayama7|uniref:CHAT domain-containing protein n=1 Tax=Coprinopsis cinerea (strain Okayama-7 / 130 / ATCC MYA-4618 / FGSC 9003) TaxID=240176 RepID=A8NQY4_COPC7|nr:hypothetical protein CC1G_03358 [Coprinopsis cinerea okayama7\|eukprot:XP_001835576.2 hypothetical protein CC1G_03358 [Coprinopsis cinerea okayama7\